MPNIASRIAFLIPLLRHMLSVRFLFLISCVSFATTIVWIESAKRGSEYRVDDNLVEEALKNVAKDYRYFEIYRKPNRLSKDLKYILLWTPEDFSPFYFLGSGQRSFIKNNCSVINCYVTPDRYFFGGDVTKFNAIAFNGRNMKHMWQSHLPKERSAHQKYIFFNMESADNYPVCQDFFDNFFNWTATYRLNSDIPYPYILIRNVNGDIVGPKRNMEWEDSQTGIDEELINGIQNKTKAAAWFVSHCSSRSGRKEFVKKLQSALSPYGLSVDVYGSCGPFSCPIDRKSECDNILKRDYYFYLSLENSFDEDYVTEKLLTALQHNVVPIVYGGADYSRFLPPGSYLDGRRMNPHELAATMARLINSPMLYRHYFRWQNHYTYHDPSSIENVCDVCAALNNKDLYETPTVYKEFRRWWNPNYLMRC